MHDIAGAVPRVNSHSATANKKFTLSVKIEPDGETIHLEGRPAWAMQQLIDAGQRGCTPITHPGPRWSDYTFKLRKLGFVIETEYQSHSGPFAGNHGVYHLHSKVSIVQDMAAAA
ncbi:hypothetical protein [Mesorhizobium sp.]|uniref:winged helix domain-containing protein n=1 Tax=Mesorhizobium sp. TaxID=1871066 RepID=UPI000FE32044|nr:hypothetical protein [Mesorhizobium sp.]RWN51896.1 MAG: hypothetical protein EOR98_23880 [Mesorhizobium sp.]RWN73094.1 MAG: hypothetical protein EOS02_25715 [Mesorhizobium sp.]RWN76277.1 MAG: hypothetical protein EOS01_21435 [Mesorhizobium sp.]RWN86024.1 MAG: hypothetical protein EOS04_20835 [Mesorhizobium sp.]RWO11788.1 MAG: hypothetical protein EOS15_22060 [Mesorhizobium sp.]